MPERAQAFAVALAAVVALAALVIPPAEARGAAAPEAPTVVVVPGEDDAQSRIELPAYPKDADLVALPAGSRADLRFLVDARSVRVLPGGELRYTFVAISPSGSRSVSFEQMRCESREWRVLAVGGSLSSWTPARQPRWRVLPEGDAFGQRAVLHKDIFCPGRVPVADVREAIAALRAGVHPRAMP